MTNWQAMVTAAINRPRPKGMPKVNAQGMPTFGKTDPRRFWEIAGGNALPDGLYTGPSDIHGIGVFSRIDIEADTEIGPFAIDINGRLWRIGALASFVNHSDDPNCERVEDEKASMLWFFKTIKKIPQGEELTMFYAVRRENPEEW